MSQREGMRLALGRLTRRELVAVVGRRGASRSDRSESEVVEDVCGEVGVGEEREHAQSDRHSAATG
jgi:hypothetical protein